MVAAVVLVFAGAVGIGARVAGHGPEAQLATSTVPTTPVAPPVVEGDEAAQPVAGGIEAPPGSSPETIAPATTTTAPVVTTVAPRAAAAAVTPSTTRAKRTPPPKAPNTTTPAGRAGVFGGLGTWADVYDWAPSYVKNGGSPTLAPDTATAAMAAQGVQTLFIQAARADNPAGGDLVDPGVLAEWVRGANSHGIRVVTWYLPTFEDVDGDLRRAVAAASLSGVAGFALDIESTKVKDPDTRSARLVDLATRLRAALPNTAISACTLPNVVTDVINTNYWPRFPWHQIAPFFDVWQPMDYWTNRADGNEYRDANRYTSENIDRMRAQLGMPNAVVSPVGGIANKVTPADIAGFLAACQPRACIGGSLYDWATQQPDSYAPMRQFRR